jgi:hypothetical protein
MHGRDTIYGRDTMHGVSTIYNQYFSVYGMTILSGNPEEGRNPEGFENLQGLIVSISTADEDAQCFE